MSDVPQRKSTRGERRGATIDGEGGGERTGEERQEGCDKINPGEIPHICQFSPQKYNNKPFTVQGFEDYKMIQMKIF